jgi:hypothetical protein
MSPQQQVVGCILLLIWRLYAFRLYILTVDYQPFRGLIAAMIAAEALFYAVQIAVLSGYAVYLLFFLS